MSQNNHYLALTIGPIYNTLKDMRKTRHLWGGSYLFSYLMKLIYQELEKCDKNDVDIVLPKIPKNVNLQKGVGFFPDKIMFASKSGKGKAILQNCINGAILKIATTGNIHPIRNLQQYLQTYILEMDISEGVNVIETLNKRLEFLEQRQQFNEIPLFDLTIVLDALNRHKSDGFYKDAFGTRRITFPSIAEIATTTLKNINETKFNEFFKNNDDGDDDDFYQKLDSAFPNGLRQHHKYIVVVYADGDSVSKIIEKIGVNTEGVKKFSEKLHQFADAAVDRIIEYGGTPVYAGGDDLLFFAPVAVEKSGKIQTFLHLFNSISAVYKDNMSKDYPDTTLSFGAAITYYKFPLNEALGLAYSQLNYIAKEQEGKNAVAFKFLKHSGHAIEGLLLKEQASLSASVLPLLENFIGSEKNQFLSSIQYNIAENQEILKYILNKDNAQQRLSYFFEHTFNEDVHQGNTQLKKVQELMWESFKSAKLRGLDTQQATNQAIKAVFALLRFVQFINADFKNRLNNDESTSSQLATTH